MSVLPGRRRRRRSIRRRRVLLLTAVVAVLALAAVGGWLAVDRYLPALDEARSLQADVVSVAGRVQAAGLDVDGPLLDGLDRDIAAARARLDRLASLLDDPLLGLVRTLPPTRDNVRGADAIVTAGKQLLAAADPGLAIGRRFVEIKERSADGSGADSSLARLVELMATTRQDAVAAQSALTAAKTTLATVPAGLIGPVESARAAMAQRIDTYLPLLDAYVVASARLPSILGWDAPRRYLVLTQNPAEIRPTGGFTGSYGILVFDQGQLTEHDFRDVFLLDGPTGHPFVQPPEELVNYLLGPDQSWQLADANWSPDFPKSAQDAARLYGIESGDLDIDGVLGITTHTIDEILQVTGPITVPAYDATIGSGETTLKTLQLTRIPLPGENRKAFLSAFADELFARLLALPPSKWGEVLGHVDTFRSQRLLLAWFKDPADQALAADSGFDGAVRQDPGDFVYPVDSNVVPASKINAIATRHLQLDVVIDELGNALNTLEVTWENPIDTEIGRPYRALPEHEDLRILGMYFRLLAPERSRVESVSGGTFDILTAPAVVEVEAGRTVIGTYLMIPPGRGTLRYVWTSPYTADVDPTESRYHLTIQKQPGLLPGPLAVTVHAPSGARIVSASPGLEVKGNVASLTTSFDQDLEFDLGYVPAGAPAN